MRIESRSKCHTQSLNDYITYNNLLCGCYIDHDFLSQALDDLNAVLYTYIIIPHRWSRFKTEKSSTLPLSVSFMFFKQGHCLERFS